MGSSAQNSCGVHWCRRGDRFNEVPEKAPKVPEKVWEALVQSQVTIKKVPENPDFLRNLLRNPVEPDLDSDLHQGFWNLLRNLLRNPLEPDLALHQSLGEGSGEGLAGFGAEPGHVQQGSKPLMDRKVIDVSSLSLSFSDYLPTYLPACLPTYLPTHLPTYLPTYLPTSLSLSLCLSPSIAIPEVQHRYPNIYSLGVPVSHQGKGLF